tara:strand:- start:3663 stop:4649 length:987 start_codon:yes stop_codon:yes gene_type:complete
MPKIVAVGDSITKARNSYIDILGGQKFAIGGKASYSLMGMLQKAVATRPDYVIIFAGINNPMGARACRGGWDTGLISDLSTMYSTAKAAGARVVGVTLVPAHGWWNNHYRKCARARSRGTKGKGCCPNNEIRNPKTIHKQLLDVNSWIRSNADIVIDAGAKLADEHGSFKKYLADNVHLNRRGHAWIADEIKRRVGGGTAAPRPKVPVPASPVPTSTTRTRVKITSRPRPAAAAVTAPSATLATTGTFRGWRRFKKENPDFKFKTFYQDLDTYFEKEGGARGVLSRYGRDRIFGSEHFAAWQKLQKAKSEEGEKLSESVFKRWSMITS